MTSMGFRAVLAILLLFVLTVTAQKGEVTFYRKTFTMICPYEDDDMKWFKNEKVLPQQTAAKYELNYSSETAGFYHCNGSSGGNYYFFVKGKVCENCFELDGFVFALVIAVDVAGTAFLMIIIFRCTKNRSSAGPTHSPKAAGRSGGRPPPLPSPDYEQLNAHTRSQDTYSIVNRTG